MSAGAVPDGGDEDSPDRWERVGRELLAERLEIVAMQDVREAFLGAKARLDAGEELTEQDINDLRSALENAAHVVDAAAEASPEAAPSPDMWQFLDEDARSEWVREAERRLPSDD